MKPLKRRNGLTRCLADSLLASVGAAGRPFRGHDGLPCLRREHARHVDDGELQLRHADELPPRGILLEARVQGARRRGLGVGHPVLL